MNPTLFPALAFTRMMSGHLTGIVDSDRPSEGGSFEATLHREIAMLGAVDPAGISRAPVRYEFPPGAAPEAFKSAWSSVSAGMDPGDRMTYELEIWGRLHPEFSSVDQEGSSQPPREDDPETYRAIIQNHLDSMATRPELYTSEYLRDAKAVYQRLLDHMTLH